MFSRAHKLRSGIALAGAVLALFFYGSAHGVTTVDCASDPAALQNAISSSTDDTYEIDGTCDGGGSGFLSIEGGDHDLVDSSGAAGMIDGTNISIDAAAVSMNGVDIGGNVDDIYIQNRANVVWSNITVGSSGGSGPGPSTEIYYNSNLTVFNSTIGSGANSSFCTAICIFDDSSARLRNVTVNGDSSDFTVQGTPVQVTRDSSITIEGNSDISNLGTTPGLSAFWNSTIQVREGPEGNAPTVSEGMWIGTNSGAQVKAGTLNDGQSGSQHALRVSGDSTVTFPVSGFRGGPVTINGGNGQSPEAILASDDSYISLRNDGNLSITAGAVVCRDSSRMADTGYSSATGMNCSNLHVADGGNVGVGTSTPSRKFTVVDDGGGSESQPMRLVNPTGKLRFLLTADGETWTFDNTGADAFTISKVGTGAAEMAVAGNGNMTIRGTLTEGSSRAIKAAIESVDPSAILTRLQDLALSEWSYKGEDGARHLGPMAEDFHSTFGLGQDAKHIAPKDLAGVAMASAKALKGELDAKSRKIERLEERNSDLEARVDELAETVSRLSDELE